MTWRLPGPGERVLSQHFASASAVSGMRSMHLETVHAYVWSGARCSKCGGEGVIPVDAKGRPSPEGDRNVECSSCRGTGATRAFRSQAKQHEPMFRTARCEPCRGATGRTDCPACRGEGYVEALTANLSEMARAGAPPEIDDALWHQWARVARRLDRLSPASRAVLEALFGDVGSELDRLAVYPLTAAGKALFERGTRRVRKAHAKATNVEDPTELRRQRLWSKFKPPTTTDLADAPGRLWQRQRREMFSALVEQTIAPCGGRKNSRQDQDLGLSKWDIMGAEMERPEARTLKADAERQVDALLGAAFEEWNAAGPRKRDEVAERVLAKAAGVDAETWRTYRTAPEAVSARVRERCETIERWAARAAGQ